VAEVSAVPGGYAAADGTSVAAAHVSGMAALVLAHHPLFTDGPWRTRSEQRVQILCDLIRASAVPHFADTQRGGAGVPDLQRVPGELAAAATSRSAASGAWPHWAPMMPSWPAMMQLRAAGLL
jgi:subtilisin